jgi:hypothetical protein
MYGAVRSFDVQRDMLIAAVREVLPNRYAVLFEASLSVIRRAASDRNKFAHWIWGSSADPELQALLLVEPKHFWQLTVQQINHFKFVEKQTESALSAFLMPPRLDRQNIYVYQLKDLQEAQRRVERAFGIAASLRVLADGDGSLRQSLYRALCREPDIQKAVEDMKKNNPSPPKAKRVPRRKDQS